jgi:8-hydroxy-5-deazaflavin:NADPH oxidoreductase
VTSDATPDRIGILGGTGKLGAGLARRWAAAGIPVVIGSRDPDRAEARAQELRRDIPVDAAELSGASNLAAASAPLVVAAVPAEGAEELVADLAGTLAERILVSAISPLAFDASGPRPAPLADGRSAAELVAELAPAARVVAGLHTVSSVGLSDLAHPLDEDVLLATDDDAAGDVVAAAIGHLSGARPVRAGPLRLAGTLEALTAVLISINKRHRVHAGFRVTGLER